MIVIARRTGREERRKKKNGLVRFSILLVGIYEYMVNVFWSFSFLLFFFLFLSIDWLA